MEKVVPDNAGVIAPPPLIYGVALVLGSLIHLMFPISFLPTNLAHWLGVPLMLAAGLIVASAFRALGRARTTFDIRKPTTTIVADGPFRYSRNPMYISLTLLYMGLAVLINSLWILLLLLPVVLVIQNGVVKREEQYLEGKFGDAYLRYKAQVRRWI